MRVRKLAVFFLLFVLGLFFLAGCGAKEEVVQNEKQPTPVEVVEAFRGDVAVVNKYTGTVEPELVVSVVPKIGGRVVEVKVKDGDKVKAGDMLMQLEAAEIEAQVAQAAAGYEMALANLEKARSGTRVEQLEQSRAALQIAQAQYDEAKRSLENFQILYEEGAISKQQLDQVETQYKVAEGQLKQAEEALKMAKSGPTAEDIKVLEAQVSQAAAALQLARTQLDNTIITAPVEGTVSGVTLNPGEMAGPGAPVAAINKLDTMEVQVTLTEKDINRVAVGQEVEVLVSAVSPEPLPGEIHSISPVADPRSKTYLLKVLLPNEEGLLKAGMSAVVHITVEKEEGTVIIPVDSLLTQDGEQVVFVVEGELARKRVVTAGLNNGELLSVLEGIEPGDKVIVRGQHYLQDGDRVAALEGGSGQ